MARESEPMPSPLPPRSPRPSEAGTWEQTVEALDDRIERRKAEARANASGIEALRAEIGRPPNVVTGERGSGMWGSIGAAFDRLAHMDTTLTRILDRLSAIESASVTRKGWLASRGEKVLDALLVSAFLALGAAVAHKLGVW